MREEFERNNKVKLSKNMKDKDQNVTIKKIPFNRIINMSFERFHTLELNIDIKSFKSTKF